MDTLNGDVTFDHAGTVYTIRFSTGAMRRFEGATKRKFFATAMTLGEDPGIDDVVQFVRWGLSDRHELTVEATEKLIDGIGLLRSIELLTKAIEAAFQPATVKEGGRPLESAA